jgi:ABC-2 type transport system permease protein
VTSGAVAAAVLPSDGPAGVTVVVQDSAPSVLVDALTTTPQVEVLNPASQNAGVRLLITFGFGLVFMASAMGFGSTIAQSTVTEKQTRIVELLLAAVPARVLLAGKVLGNSALALGQTASIAAAAVLGLVVTGQDDLLTMVGAPMVWFVVFFAVGFVLLASLYAAAASLVSRMEDTGPVLMPVMYLVMIPYFLVVFAGDNETVLRVMSYVPFSAPVGMPVRLYIGDAAWWEPLLSLVILAVSTLVVVEIAARVYERSVLRTGARVPLSAVLGRRRVAV